MDSPDQNTLPARPSLVGNGPASSMREDVPTIPLKRGAPVAQARNGSRKRPALLMSCMSVAFLLLGVLLGSVGAWFYVSSNAGDRQVPSTPPPPADAAIAIKLSPAYLSQVLSKEVTNLPGVPGEITNIQVTTEQDGSMTVTGDDQINILLGFSVTKRITLRLQPYVNACQLQMHVLHADLDGVPITPSLTAFYTQLENQINQQLQASQPGSSHGFTYCITGVHAAPDGLQVTLSATATS